MGRAHKGEGGRGAIFPPKAQLQKDPAWDQMHELSADLTEVPQAATTAEQWDSGMASGLLVPWLAHPWG